LAGIIALGVNQEWNRVTQVIDGDTFRIANGQKVRLVGIDAPELAYCGGAEAKAELEKLALGKKVILTEIKADNFGRILALAYVSNSLINQKMLTSGWARWDGTENNLGPTLAKARDRAQQNAAGIWGKCRIANNPGCVIKGNIEKRSGITAGGKKSYFFPGCSEYEVTVVEKELGEDWYCTEAKAQAAGFVKAANCYGKSWRGAVLQ
jgi:micrococcal nuclease